MASSNPIILRAPSFSPATTNASTFRSPTIPWLMETWHVTHSSLPMWKSKRNVRIQYKALPPSKSGIPSDNTDRVDDTVTYQSLDGEKVSTIHGVDSCAGSDETRGEWDWRGKGWLKMASSHWEILGWGVEEGSGNKWVVTIFAKTIFTPAGIDVYSQDANGLSEVTVQQIKEGLAQVEDENVKQMALDLFELTIDGARKN